MIIHTKPARMAIVIGGLLLLSACSRSVSNVDSQGHTASPVFPKATSAVRTEGSFVNLDNLKEMKPGLTKAQVYELIGTPHFNEGVLKVKEWDYIFHFTKADKTILTCQYKVLFDKNMKAQSFFFLPENCLDQLVVKKAPAPVHHDLSAESLFAFGSATMQPAGAAQVKALANDLSANEQSNKRIIVTGYTDRFGSKASNQQLSQARAASVKRALVENGIPASNIEARGMGDSEPRVYCAGPKSAAVVQCLAPNRRVSIDVVNP